MRRKRERSRSAHGLLGSWRRPLPNALLTALPSVMLLVAGVALAQGANQPMNVGDVTWGPVPGFLPPGAQISVLDGDPSQAVSITLRLSMPAGYVIPPHSHPTLENVTVLSGTLNVSMGDTFDETTGTALDAGGFVALPPEMNHYVWTDAPTVVQVNLMGPFEITYVNPADDPRNQ